MTPSFIATVCRRILAEQFKAEHYLSLAEDVSASISNGPESMSRAIQTAIPLIAAALSTAEPVKRPSVEEIVKILDTAVPHGNDGLSWQKWCAKEIHAMLPTGQTLAEVAAELKDGFTFDLLEEDGSGSASGPCGEHSVTWKTPAEAIPAIRAAVAKYQAEQTPTLEAIKFDLETLKGLATFNGHHAILGRLEKFVNAQEAKP